MTTWGNLNYVGPTGPTITKADDKRAAAESVIRGGRVRDVARRYGVAESTVRRWVAQGYGDEAAREIAKRNEPDMLHEFDAWLRAEMERVGANASELAGAAGISPVAVRYILRGEVSPRMTTAAKLVDAIAGWGEAR